MTNQQSIDRLLSLSLWLDKDSELYQAIVMAISALQAQEAKTQLSAEGTTSDLISRQAALDALMDFDKKLRKINWYQYPHTEYECRGVDEAIVKIENVPSTQPTLCGYDIKLLMMIAEVLRKENLPPERITEVLTDIGRIVSIVTDEFEESLRNAVESARFNQQT